ERVFSKTPLECRLVSPTIGTISDCADIRYLFRKRINRGQTPTFDAVVVDPLIILVAGRYWVHESETQYHEKRGHVFLLERVAVHAKCVAHRANSRLRASPAWD